MAVQGCMWRRADNKRKPGWEQLHYRLIGQNGTPMLYICDACEDTIRTLPSLQHDERDTEDLDTDGEDHAADETRYAVMSRPWVPTVISAPASRLPTLPQETTINQLIEQRTRLRLARAE